jgi:hypothetical protein
MKHKVCRSCEVTKDNLKKIGLKLDERGYCPGCQTGDGSVGELAEIAEARRVPQREQRPTFTTTMDEYLF